MAAPTEAELGLLKQFREKIWDLELSEKQKTDIFLIRWIRARDGDLNKAYEMLSKSLIWRKENDIDNVLKWTAPPDFATECPYKILGYDKENSPAIMIPIGKWNLVGQAKKADGKETFVNFFNWLFESMYEKMKGKTNKSGYPVTQFTILADMDGFSFRNVASFAVIDMAIQVLRAFEQNQPESLRIAYFLNVGSTFMAFYKLVKHILSEKTASKLEFLNDKTPDWKEKVQESIPKEIIPPKYGGTSTENSI